MTTIPTRGNASKHVSGTSCGPSADSIIRCPSMMILSEVRSMAAFAAAMKTS